MVAGAGAAGEAVTAGAVPGTRAGTGTVSSPGMPGFHWTWYCGLARPAANARLAARSSVTFQSMTLNASNQMTPMTPAASVMQARTGTALVRGAGVAGAGAGGLGGGVGVWTMVSADWLCEKAGIATPTVGAPAPDTAAANSSATSRADCWRSSRRLASARNTTASTAGEMLALRTRIGGGSCCTCCMMTAVTVGELNGTTPHSISNSTTPRL